MNANAKNFHTKRPARKKKPLAAGPSSLRGSGSTQCPHHLQSHPSDQPVLDQRVPELLLDAISSVKAAIVSASAMLSYGEVRQAMAVNEQEQQELTRALREAAERHPVFFRQNKTEIEFCVAWAAVHAAQIDNLLTLTDKTNTMEEPGCSFGGSLLIALLVLGPLLIFAVISIVQHLGDFDMSSKTYTVRVPAGTPDVTSEDVGAWLDAQLASGGPLAADPGAGERTLRLSFEQDKVKAAAQAVGEPEAVFLRRLIGSNVRVPEERREAEARPKAPVLRGCGRSRQSHWCGCTREFSRS